LKSKQINHAMSTDNNDKKDTSKVEDKSEKECFVIMPISDTAGYDIGHFNRVFNHLIEPACKKAGFKAVRADQTSKSNLIVLDILKKIMGSEMVLCDLSSNNPNVLYELGIRQAFDKKTVLIKDKKTSKIFDIDGIRRCEYDESLRIDTVEVEIAGIATTLTETYDNKQKDGNSLIQLLGITPASTPKDVPLSVDTSVLLNAINGISSKLEDITHQKNRDLYDPEIKIGSLLAYKDDPEFPIGEVIKITPKELVMKNNEGENKYISRSSSDIILSPIITVGYL